jgi:DNA-binding IclR family transcriptional regulator
LAGHALAESVHGELDAVRLRGWSLSVAGVAGEGATSLGAAVDDGNGVPVAAVTVSAVSFRMPPESQQRTGELLVEAVASLRMRGARDAL